MLSHKLLPNNRRFVPAGETEVILRSATKVLIMHSGYALVAWEEAPFFTERGRAALAWTEAVTKVGEGHVLGSVFEQAHLHFGEKELVDLTPRNYCNQRIEPAGNRLSDRSRNLQSRSTKGWGKQRLCRRIEE